MSPLRETLHLERRRGELSNSLVLLKQPAIPTAGSEWLSRRLCDALHVRRALTAVVGAALLIGAAACGSSNPTSAAPSAARLAKALKGSPPKLEGLHRQASELIGGSKSEFDARLASLRGYPVVVNKWAAWCGPCRSEFPVFQKAGLELGKRVAFLGVDGQDNDGDARKFLKQYPVIYPSYRDPDLKISTSIQAGIAFPTTIFFNRQGKLVYAHPGPYTNAAQLITDIRRYAE
jgi:cytochrome c biogenesis protein CcmG, thiol:disulfide interchange protein DsbE